MAYLLPKVRRVVGNAECVSDDPIGLRMRYEAAIYQVEIAPTTLSGLEVEDLLKPLNRHILKL